MPLQGWPTGRRGSDFEIARGGWCFTDPPVRSECRDLLSKPLPRLSSFGIAEDTIASAILAW